MPPKKKSAKKKDLGPKLKAPIGRPRKNLGTRVSDLPLVSTIKPTTRRVNIDSLAMNRARLAYKRDYGKTLDEYTSRALIDAMSTTKRGPIGTNVIGTVKGKEVVLGTSTEASGFFDYYKKAKKAAETNPSQKTTLKRKSDDTWVVITPGIPAVTSGTIAATTVPKTSAKSAKSAADRAAKLEDLNATQTKLVNLLESGSLSPAASRDAKERLKKIKESILSLSIGSDSPVASPLDDAASLVKERRKLDEISRDPRFTPAERNAAEAKRDRLDKNILEFEAAKRATERDIVEAQLGPLDKQSKMEADLVEERQNLRAIRYFKDATQDQINQAQARIAEINDQLVAINQARAPLISGVVPTRTIRRDEAGPSTSSATAPRAPATSEAVEAVEAALADPGVSAIVEQAKENATVSTKTAKNTERATANMRMIADAARMRAALKAANAKQKAEQARLKEEYAAVEALPEDRPKSRRTFDQDFEERERIGQSSREEGAKFLQMAKDARDREAATRVAATIAAPTPFVALQRKQRKKTTANETEKARIREIERLEQEAIDQKRELDEEEALKQAMIDKAIQDQLAEDAAAEARLAEYDRAEYERRVPERAATKISAKQKRIQEGLNVPEVDEPIRPTADSLREQAARLKRIPTKSADVYINPDLAERVRKRNEDTRRLIAKETASAVKEQLAQLKKAAETRERGFVPFTVNDDPLAQALADKSLRLKSAMVNEAVRDEYNARLKKLRATADERDAAVRVIQRAVRDKVEGVAKQKRLVSKIQAMNELIPEPVPSAPTIDEDIIDENDVTDEFGMQDDAARKIQAALRRFGDRSRFAKAREIEAEYAAQDDIIVPGADIRPNNRVVVVPDTERMARALQEAGYTQMKRSYESLPENPETGKLLGFPREVPRAYDTARLPLPFKRAGPDYEPADLVFESERGPAFRAEVDPDLADRIRRRNEETERLLKETTGSGLVGGSRDRHFVGGVLRRLRGMGFFDRDGLDNILYPMPKAMDNKQLLADAKAAYAARGATGGTFDGRTDFRVLMDAMKTIPRRQGGAMGGGRVFLSGASAPTGGGAPVLYEIQFPVKDWKTSSSLRWLRSNGIKPMKKATQSGSVYKYTIASSKGLKEPYTSNLNSRGRMIHMMYGNA